MAFKYTDLKNNTLVMSSLSVDIHSLNQLEAYEVGGLSQFIKTYYNCSKNMIRPITVNRRH